MSKRGWNQESAQNCVDAVTAAAQRGATWRGHAWRGRATASRRGVAGWPRLAHSRTILVKPSSVGISGSLFTKSPRRARSGNWRLCSLRSALTLAWTTSAAPSDYYSHNQRCTQSQVIWHLRYGIFGGAFLQHHYFVCARMYILDINKNNSVLKIFPSYGNKGWNITPLSKPVCRAYTESFQFCVSVGKKGRRSHNHWVPCIRMK